MFSLTILNLLFSFQLLALASPSFLDLFKNKKPMIAALMVDKEITDPKKYEKILLNAKEQIKIAQKAEMDGILFEFRGGKILEPKISKSHFQVMLKFANELVKAKGPLVIGLEILWHYPEETLLLAKQSGANFVRIDFFSDAVIADKKRVKINPKEIIKYKKTIHAESVFLLTDLQVKYSEMIDKKMTLEQSATKARIHGSDGLIVTSTKSGEAPDPVRPQTARKGSKDLPIIIGSGFSHKNVKTLLPYADAVIVGTSISAKTGGPLMPEKVEQLMKAVKEFRKNL